MRPKITLKLATSLDGKIALANGEAKWVTSEAARAHGRSLRAEHDAIAVGANTVEMDNPKLTTRIEGKTNPIRMVFDSSMRLSLDCHLVRQLKRHQLGFSLEPKVLFIPIIAPRHRGCESAA